MFQTQKNIYKPKTNEESQIFEKLCHHSARLYNVGLYNVRQWYFNNSTYLPYVNNYHHSKNNENYGMLPSDSAQTILRIVDWDMKSFFGLLKLKSQGKYSEKVNLPKYKKPESISNFVIQGRAARIRNGKILVNLTKKFRETYSIKEKSLSFTLPDNMSHVTQLQELRIIPLSNNTYEVEYIYQAEVKENGLDVNNALSLDFGLDNLVTTFNSMNGSSFIIDGKYIKSVNQSYNKRMAELKSLKEKHKVTHVTQKQLQLQLKRKHQINDYLNRSVKIITDYCLNNNVGKLIIGEFSGIKNGINMGKKNNQNFVSIPYGKLKQKLKSKCELLSIEVIFQEESYTSKCSFLDQEDIQKHDIYQGKRIKRGLFKTSNKTLVSADVNGAANIMIKSKHRLDFQRVSKGFVNNPVRLVAKSPTACR